MRKIYHSKLAEFIHETWSGWINTILATSIINKDRSVTIRKSVSVEIQRHARATFRELKDKRLELYEDEVECLCEDLEIDSLLDLLHELYNQAIKNKDEKQSINIKTHIVNITNYFKRINICTYH